MKFGLRFVMQKRKSETDDEDRSILHTDISLRDDCRLFGPWTGYIGQGHLYLDRIR